MSEIGENFYEIMLDNDMAEDVTLTDPDGESVTLRMSVIPNTKSSYMQTEREYLLYGVMTFPDEASTIEYRGCYFTRNKYAGRVYILMSTIPEPSDSRLATVFVEQCNNKVDIAYLENVEDPNTGDIVTVPTVFAEDVDVYVTSKLQREQETQDGNLDRTIWTMTMPAAYTIAQGQVVLMNGFVEKDVVVNNVSTKQNVLEKKRYRVDSIDASMMSVIGDGQIVGTVTVQLSDDLRAGET